MEEEDGYLIGEAEPFIMVNSEAIVVWPAEEREETDVLPPRDVSVESTGVFNEDKLEMLLNEERVAAAASVTTADPGAVLKGRLELYMLYAVFDAVAAEAGGGDLSDKEPLATE